MYRRVEVEIDPAKLLGVYKYSPGVVSYRNLDGEVYYQRSASTEEVLAEARHREIVGLLRQFIDAAYPERLIGLTKVSR